MFDCSFVGDKSAPWAEFLRTPAVWAIIVAHFCYNYGYYTLLAWLPSYFELALGLPVDSSSLLTLIPYITMVVMTPFVGPVADGLVKKGWTITRVRKLAQVGNWSLILLTFIPLLVFSKAFKSAVTNYRMSSRRFVNGQYIASPTFCYIIRRM